MQLLRIDWNVIFTIINVLILYFGLRKFLIKPVTNIMEKRRKLIDGQFADAKKTTEEANGLKAHYEDALQQAHEESERIIEKARKTAQIEYEARVGAADKEAEKIIANAHRTIEIERDKTVKDLQTQIAGLAMLAAGKVLGEADAATQNQLMYEQFLAKTGGLNDTNSK